MNNSLSRRGFLSDAGTAAAAAAHPGWSTLLHGSLDKSVPAWR